MADQTPIKKKRDEKSDVIVDIGDMSMAKVSSVDLNDNYEDMTEDYIGNFNHIVTQGQAPIDALFSFAQAFAIVLGCCIRAGLPQAEVGKLMITIGKNAEAASRMVKILSTTDVQTAVHNAVKANKRKGH